MPRHLTTVTPENVVIEYELAGFASRCGAAVLDTLVQIGAVAIAGLLYLLLITVFRFSVAGWPTTALIIAGFLLWYGYYVYFETVRNGQTPGKKALRLRVVRYGGTPIDLSCAAIRGLVRVVDLTVIGLISVLVTPNNQRLGDFAAGTLVVKERAQWEGDIRQPAVEAAPDCPEAELVRNIELLAPEHFDMAKRFCERAAELSSASKEQLAARIAIPLMQQLGIEDRPGLVYSNLINAIYDKCATDRGMR